MREMAGGTHQRVADRLLADGLITRADHDKVVDWTSRHHVRVEDALIELDVMSEPDLLKFVATLHSTQFVSTEKLSRAVIAPRTLAKVPLTLAERHRIFPVLLDEAGEVLSVVTADPDNAAVL